MISLVVVSHSAPLARAALALAAEMTTQDGPVIEVAAGLDETTTGTDAAAVAAAIQRADTAGGGDGVLVLLDLGSAVLSAEMALEFLDPDLVARVHLSPAPLVEGLMAAVVAAGTGADLQRCAQEAAGALGPKRAHLGAGSQEPDRGPGDGSEADQAEDRGWPSVELSVIGKHGLHARPAARVVACAAQVGSDTRVRIRNLTSGRGPVDALSLSAVATLDARQGHVLLVAADGPGAEQVLAELQELAGTAFGDDPAPSQPLQEAAPPAPAVSTEPGVAGSGLEAAIGPVIRADLALDRDSDDPPSAGEQQERDRFERAVEIALQRLAALAQHARRHLGDGEAGVFEAHAILLEDPELRDGVQRRIGDGASAAAAWRGTIAEVARTFEELPDTYQRERAQDVRSVGGRVMRLMLEVEEPEALGEGVLVVDDLDPALAVSLDAAAIQGVVTRRGGRLGHGVLIAQARGVPVLTGVGDVVDVPEGTIIAFDVRSGRLEVDPSPEVRRRFEGMVDRRRRERERALADTHLPVVTTDGRRVGVLANVASLAEARLGAGLGAEGSGLVRSEAVFARWRTAPSVEQQAQVYAAIAAVYHPHPVAVRTWDVGGDKPLPFIPGVPETNPFLGVRGVRAFVDDPEILLTQLEAICRVAVDHRIDVMFPMVTTTADVERSREHLEQAARRAGLHGLPEGLGVGIMVEVPAAALRVEQLARGLDFVSIGSNDLSQYVLAAERGNPRVADWSDALEPAVLQLIADVCAEAPTGVRVGLCGGMAADPDIAPLLVGLGVQDLSTSPVAVPPVKARLRTGSVAEFTALADRALRAPDAQSVRRLLLEAAGPAHP